MKRTLNIIIGISIIGFLFISNVAFAQTETTEDDLFDMSIEDLLNQNVTTVSKSEEKVLDAPGMVSVLNKDEIAMFGGTTLSGILERVPGISLNSSSLSDRSIVTSRGEQITATSNHILLLINGRPIRESLEGGVSSEMYESFPVNAIERIEVIKGPGSVLYGSNAFSGVVNVITQTADQTEVNITGLAGANAYYGASGNVKVKKGDFEMFASGQFLQKPTWETEFTYTPSQGGQSNQPDNGLSTPDDPNNMTPPDQNLQTQPDQNTPMQPENNQPGMQPITQNISIPNSGLGFYFNAKYKNWSFISTVNQWETLTVETPGTARWGKEFANLGYDLNFGENWTSTINIGYTMAHFETDTFPSIKRNSNELLAEWTHHVSLSDKAKLVFGGLYTYSNGQETNIIDESIGLEGNRFTYGAYAQADYKIIETLKFTAGLQANKIEGIDLKLVPRAALVWNPTKNLNFKALYSEAFRAPSLMELYIDQTFRQGNSNLSPESVGTIDIGATYINDKFQIGLNYFNSNLNDIINIDHTTTIPTYQNLGQVTFNGGELETKYYINQSIFFTGSALYQTNHNEEGRKNLSATSNFSAKAGINYKLKQGVSLGVFNIYQGPIDEQYASAFNASPIDSYNQLSAHANFDINKLFNLKATKEMSIFFQGDNLLNKQIWTSTKEQQNNSSIPFNQGRTIYAGITIKL